jgi:hypothetical protein
VLALSVAVWAGLVVAGVRRIRAADVERIRLLTGRLGRPVTVMWSTGTALRSTRSSLTGEVIGVERHHVVFDRGGREIAIPIASIRELWIEAERLWIW